MNTKAGFAHGWPCRSWVARCVLLGGVLGVSSVGSALAQTKAAECTSFHAIDPAHPAFDRLNKVYGESLRFGGTAHRLLPHFHATYDDIREAKRKLSTDDIPYIVHDLARSSSISNRQTVAIGVLEQFGTAALPCIRAALAKPGTKGRFTLTQIEISIVAQAATKKP